jgi:glycerophosphoryl diester phosphodiesterase
MSLIEQPSLTHHAARAATGLVLTAAAVAGTVAVGPPALAADNPTVIAHRGDRSSAPENTLPAFGGAIAKGADAIEFDVQFTRTGFPVVFHDTGLSRTTNCTGRVSSKSVRQLHRCDAGSWFGPEFKGTQIPTLWDALKYIHKHSSTTKVLLHMTADPTRREARKTMQRVRRNHMLDRTIVMASTITTMARMKHAGARKRAWIFNSTAGWHHQYSIMVPYDVPVDPARIAAAEHRGAVVWTVQGHPLDVPSLLALDTPVRGILVNHLNPRLLDTLHGVVGGLTAPLATATAPLAAASTGGPTLPG